MSSFDIMIPFVLHQETGLNPDYLTLPLAAQFAKARQIGYANDPNDAGGPTMCGVTLKTYKAYRKKKGCPVTTVADLKRLSFDEWKEILKGMFWDAWKADEIKSEMVAVALVDWTWVSGKNGIKYPQRLLGVTADGIVGPKTLAAVNGYPDQKELFERIQSAREAYHVSIARPGSKKAKYLKGWNNRVAKITWEGFNYTLKK